MLDRINGKGDLEEYHLELIHRGCWGSETWNEYMDVVIDFKLKESLVETKRLVKIGNDGLISLKRLLRKYRNIDHFQFHDLGNSIYILEMYVDPSYTIIHRFLTQGILCFMGGLKGA